MALAGMTGHEALGNLGQALHSFSYRRYHLLPPLKSLLISVIHQCILIHAPSISIVLEVMSEPMITAVQALSKRDHQIGPS